MQIAMAPPPKKSAKSFLGDPGVILVFLLTLCGFIGFFAWATFTPIAQGFTTGGQLSIDSRRKTVQHLEGGIIEQILIKDRQTVKAGDPLLILANADATAQYEQLLNIIVSRSYELQRIQAQLRGDERFQPQDLPGVQVPEQVKNEAAFVQVKVFNDMRVALEGRYAVLDARINRFQAEIRGLQSQIGAFEGTIDLEQSEVNRLVPIVADQLAPAAELTNARRRLTGAQNELTRAETQIATAEASILEAEEEKRQAQRQFTADIAPQLSAVRDALLEAREQIQANEDVLSRRQVLAPISGQILNLAFTTVGGVVSPGEPLMDIVPEDEKLYVEVRVLPNQIDKVSVGMEINARFSTLDPTDPPTIISEIAIVDSDITTIQETGEQFFIARVDLPEDDEDVIALKESGDFLAGLPVEVFADMNQDRTPLSYIVQPLSDIIRKGMN